MLLIQMVVIQVITFACLVFVLIKIMYSTSFSEIKRLKSLNQEALQKSQELSAKIAEAEKQCKDKLDEAQKEANKIKFQAIEESEKQKEGVLLNAKQEAERMIKQALSTKEKIKEDLALGLQQKSLELSLVLIGRVLNAAQMSLLHQILLDQIIKDMEQIDVSKFKVQVQNGSIVAAKEIETSQRQKIMSILSGKTGKNIILEDSIDANLIAGVIVKLGNLVIDASLRQRLNEAGEALKK